MLGMMGYNSALPFSTMKELIEKLTAAIPQYVRQMIELLRNPREFIGKSIWFRMTPSKRR